MVNQSLVYLLESVLGPSKKRVHNNYAFKCPECAEKRRALGKSNTPKLEIQLETNLKGENAYHCWFCSFSGKTIKSLFKKLKVDQSKIDELKKLVKPGITTKEINNFIELPKEFKSLISANNLFSKRALKYLTNRGINRYDIIKYNIGYCEDGKYADRIIIPSYDEKHNLNYFSARSIDDSSSFKHMNPKVDKNNVIGFEFFINWNTPLIIVEGMIDAITSKRNTIPLLGKTFSEALMKKIVTSQVKKIYMGLDPDALKMSFKHVEMLLSKGKEVYLIDITKKDVNAMGFEKFTELIQKTQPITFEDLLIKKLNS